MEIPNSRVLAQVVEAVEPSKGHKGLLKAIRDRYPACEFNLVGSGRRSYREGGVFSGDGERIADSHKKWATAEFDLAGRDAGRVWEKYRDSGYLITENESANLCIAMPYGKEADAFFQIEIDATREILSHPLVDTDLRPSNLKDLQNPIACRFEQTVVVTPWSYQLANVTDIRRFLPKIIEAERQNRLASIPELPKKAVEAIGDGPTTNKEKSYLYTVPPDWHVPRRECRFIGDWNASSAGQNGHRLCDHWSLEVYAHKSRDGKRNLGYMPVPSDKAMKLQEVVSSRSATCRHLMEKLEKFNGRARYPMAWYFHMLYGQVDFAVGDRVANGLREGKINLPVSDAEIVLRWHESPYGFFRQQ